MDAARALAALGEPVAPAHSCWLPERPRVASPRRCVPARSCAYGSITRVFAALPAGYTVVRLNFRQVMFEREASIAAILGALRSHRRAPII